MRRMCCFVLTLTLIISLISCTQSTEAKWQEQYDLGVRYLSEGNYEEAVIAFTTAIEIDPKRIEAYSGLADAYLVIGDYESTVAVWQNLQIGDEALLTQFAAQGEEYARIREELESGEPGVWITTLAFDRECYLAGEETTFHLTALYRAPEGGPFQLSVSANAEEPDVWPWQGETLQVEGGVGVRRLEVSIVPPRWEGSYFGLQVGLWDEQQDRNWKWLGSDAWYITPEGDLSRHYAPVNTYGATEFVYRRDYRSFEDFTPAEQRFISTVVSAAIAGDTGSIRSQLGFTFENHENYTMWDGYKIKIHSVGSHMDEKGDEYTSIEIEVRPEKGMGYDIHISNSEKMELSLELEDHWLDYSRTNTILSCHCVDWQWSGPVSGQEYHEYLWRHRDGTTCHTTETAQISGTMADGMWEGMSTETRREVENWNRWDDTDETTTTTRVYRGGILVEENGETWGGGQGYHLISDWYGGGVGYSDDQPFLDERYW